jgi:hypothetical protein
VRVAAGANVDGVLAAAGLGLLLYGLGTGN